MIKANVPYIQEEAEIPARKRDRKLASCIDWRTSTNTLEWTFLTKGRISMWSKRPECDHFVAHIDVEDEWRTVLHKEYVYICVNVCVLDEMFRRQIHSQQTEGRSRCKAGQDKTQTSVPINLYLYFLQITELYIKVYFHTLLYINIHGIAYSLIFQMKSHFHRKARE